MKGACEDGLGMETGTGRVPDMSLRHTAVMFQPSLIPVLRMKFFAWVTMT